MAFSKDTIEFVGTVTYDDETGEVISYVKDPRKQPPPKLLPPEGERYVGIELKYPSECVTEKDLMKSLRALDGYYKNRPRVNTSILLEMATEDVLSAQQLRMVKYVAENLSGWNYCMTTISEMRDAARVSAKNFSRVLSSLSPVYLRVQHRDTPERGCLVIKINPKIAWKGDYQYQEISSKHWYEQLSLHG